jgi:HEAT repeat protein
MVALAKIGDEKDESGSSKFVEAIKPHLKSKVQEIAETAAVALGILANEDSAPDLVGLMRDNAVGRGLVGGGEVSLRTRAFAAYGLALLGARTQKEGKRSEIIENLVDVLENDQSSMRDIKVACLISIGLVPLEQIHPSDAAAEVKTLAAQSCRVGQIEYLIRYFENVKENHYLIRAHAPAARTSPGSRSSCWTAARRTPRRRTRSSRAASWRSVRSATTTRRSSTSRSAPR